MRPNATSVTWKVETDDDEGKGATFHVCFPLFRVPGRPARITRELNGARIWVADAAVDRKPSAEFAESLVEQYCRGLLPGQAKLPANSYEEQRQQRGGE